MVGLPKYTPEQRQFIYHLKTAGYSARRVVQAFNERWKGGVKGKPLSVAGVAYVCANKDHPDLKAPLQLKTKTAAGPSRMTNPYQPTWTAANQAQGSAKQKLGLTSLRQLKEASEQWKKDFVDLTGSRGFNPAGWAAS